MSVIRGEYWIHPGGHVDFADGSVGERNHEGIVCDAVLREVIETFGGDADSEYVSFDDLEEAFKAEYPDEVAAQAEKDGVEPDSISLWPMMVAELMRIDNIPENEAREKLKIAQGNGDARRYASKKWGWVAVRGDHVESWDLSRDAWATISRGLEEILDQEGFYDRGGTEDEDPESDPEFYISCYSTSKRHYLTLSQIAGAARGDLEAPAEDPENVAAKVATNQLDKINRQTGPEYYAKKHFGDSVERSAKALAALLLA